MAEPAHLQIKTLTSSGVLHASSCPCSAVLAPGCTYKHQLHALRLESWSHLLLQEGCQLVCAQSACQHNGIQGISDWIRAWGRKRGSAVPGMRLHPQKALACGLPAPSLTNVPAQHHHCHLLLVPQLLHRHLVMVVQPLQGLWSCVCAQGQPHADYGGCSVPAKGPCLPHQPA